MTIAEKAAATFGSPVNLSRLLRAIADGQWTTEDARLLKEAETASRAEAERMWRLA